MGSRRLVCVALLWAGCGGGAGSEPDSGASSIARDAAREDAATIERDASLEDAGVDASASVDASAPAMCEPAPGGASVGAYCDLFELAILRRAGLPTEARLSGRVSPEGVAEGGCATIDEVDVLEGSSVVATLEGAGAFATGLASALLAAGEASAPLTTRCEGDTQRFGGFGLVLRGRVDGGTLEARCADAEGGSRWPPALRVTCHEGLSRQPAYAHAAVMSHGALTTTTLDVTVPHAPGEALTSVSGSVHVIPASAPFGPPAPMPFDASGWTTSASEGTSPVFGLASTLQLFADRALFTTELCPVPASGPPGPGAPPPVLLVRLTGSGERGAFSTEAYVDSCYTLGASP